MSINIEMPQVAALRREVEKVVGNVGGHDKFVKLTELIENKCKEHISVTTLERLWGYSTRNANKISERILDIIARFVDANNWEDFCIGLSRNRESIPDREAYERICRLISAGRLIYGGGRDPQRFAVEPTIIDQLPPDSPVFNEEIFGPVLPVMEFFSEEELLVQLKKNPRPLAVYCFGVSKELKCQLLENIPSGATVFNDVMLQFANMHLPFGGIGNSGFGAYHGKLTFETFCHRKAVMYKPGFPDWPPRYPGSFFK